MECTSGRSWVSVAVVASAVAWIASGSSAQDGWKTYQGDASHSGFVNIAIDPDSVALHWDATIQPGSPLTPVAAAEGRVYVAATGYFTTQGVYARDAETGEPLWSALITNAFSVNAPALDSGRVYFQSCNHSSDTWLWCYDGATGMLQFKQPTSSQWEHYYAPTIFDGVAYCNGGYYGGLYALDSTTGYQYWWKGLAQYDEWTPAVDAERVYAYVGGDLSVFDRLTGILAFSVNDPNFDWHGWSMQLAPILGGQDDVIVIQDGRLVSFDLAAHDVRWERVENFVGQPAVTDGLVYAINGGSLQARDQATGDFVWNWSPVVGTLTGNVVVTASHVIVGTTSTTHFINRSTHLSETSYPAAGHIAVDDRNVYLSTSTGHLLALEYQTLPKPSSATPAKANFNEPMPLVTIHGTGFDPALPLTVSFGARQASDVLVLDAQTLQCVPPSGEPGHVDVTLVNEKGSGTLVDGFSYIPLVDVSGSLIPGGDVLIEVECEVGHQILLLDSAQLAPPSPLPPFAGKLWLASLHRLLSVSAWPFESLKVGADIPDDPALVGLTIYLQALVGPSIGGGQAAFTNSAMVAIQVP